MKKTAPDGANTQPHGYGNSMTESVQWGRLSEKNSAIEVSGGFVILKECRREHSEEIERNAHMKIVDTRLKSSEKHGIVDTPR